MIDKMLAYEVDYPVAQIIAFWAGGGGAEFSFGLRFKNRFLDPY